MDQETFNLSIRKFLKMVGSTRSARSSRRCSAMQAGKLKAARPSR